MKGSLRRPPKEIQNYYCWDYRDPPPRQLPPVPKYVLGERKFCQGLTSEKEIRSRDDIYDTIRALKLFKKSKQTSYSRLRDRQREILLDIPRYNARQVRRIQQSPIEYLPHELSEDGYNWASSALTYFIRMDEVINDDEPTLKNSPDILVMLATILKELESLEYTGDSKQKVSLALYTAYFLESNEKWWWLAKEFYKIVRIFSQTVTHDNGYSEALINYLYGKFLLLKDFNSRDAKDCLERSHSLSELEDWSAEWLTEIKNETLAENASQLLQIALKLEANRIVDMDPITASTYLERAKKLHD